MAGDASAPDQDVQEAISELHQYLMDRIPPLTSYDSLELLMRYPPSVLMGGLRAWVALQSRGDETISISDYLFHALKKMQLFGDLRLIPNEKLRPFMERLIPLAIELCPEEEQELLARNLVLIFEGEGVLGSNVTMSRPVIATTAPPRKAPAENLSEEAGKTFKRFSLIIERLERQAAANAPANGTAPGKPKSQIMSRLASMAATYASSSQELDENLSRIGAVSGEGPKNVFALLGAAIPPWNVSLSPEARQAIPAVRAMERVLALADSPMESARRYREMMVAAVDHLNEGSLSAAVSMLELASRTAAERKIDAAILTRIQGAALDSIDLEQLKKAAADPGRRDLVRNLLSFFPAFSPEGLLTDLDGEPRREKRRTLLTFLEAHGTPAREAALARLETALQGEDWQSQHFYLRNLIYLLHRIPAAAGAPVDKELEILTRLSQKEQPILLIRESINALSQLRTDKVVRVLVTRLAEFEALLTRNDTLLHTAQDIQGLLDRITLALSRTGQPRAFRAVATHGAKPAGHLGDNRARLACLGVHDLSVDAETVSLLIKTARAELPGKLLGIVLPKKQGATIRILEGLAGTRTPPVLELLEEIQSRYPDQDLGRAAKAILETPQTAQAAPPESLRPPEGGEEFETPAPAPEPVAASSLTGDLQFFGLPTLLQGLADTSAWGQLSIVDDKGAAVASIRLAQGRIASATLRSLRGDEAMLQLLERPIEGRFSFTREEARSEQEGGTEVMRILLEGMRRYDELQEMSTLIPDEMAFKATASRPSRQPDESDPALLREVWLKATSGAPLKAWEGEIAADSYRIRKLLTHWFEEGALVGTN